MKLPRRQFLHLAAGAAALPAVSRIARAQAYPSRPVRIIVGFAARRPDRHPRAPDRAMAVGAAWPAIHRREPAGRRRQYRAPRRSCVRPPTAIRSCWSFRQRDQRDALRQAQFQFPPRHRAGRGHHPRALGHGGQSVVSGQDGSRVHRLCQGQSGQDQHGVGAATGPQSSVRRAVQDDDRRRHGARALSRHGACADRSDRRSSAGRCSHHAVRRSSTSRPASCARWR